MKIIALSVSAVGLLYATVTNVLLIVSDAGWIAISSIAASFFSFMAVILTLLINRKVNVVKESIDGLLEEKTKADVDIGRVRELERAEKEKAIGDSRELEIRKEHDLINQQPPGSKSESNVIDKESLEKEIRNQGEKIKEAVKEKGDEIKAEVPEVTADKVVEKIDPKK